MAQFDRYHKYPVDKHSILAVKCLENIKYEYILSIYSSLQSKDKELLKFIVLFHDIGKGRVSNHSKIGSTIFKSYAKQLGIKDTDIDMGAKLILHHTLMSNTAQREDIHSEKVILSFVSSVQNKNILDMLFVLTYCDISSVSDGLYTTFTADLLKELYENSLLMIDKKELVGEAIKRKRKQKKLELNPKFKDFSPLNRKKILAIESNLFFIKFKPEQIIDISNMAFFDDDYVFKIQNESRFILHLVVKKEFNLGWFLSKFVHIDLVSMDIFKLFNRAKYFRIEFSTVIDDGSEYIKYLIESSFDMTKKVIYKRPIIQKNEITINHDHSLTYSKMTLKCKNQKGLMANVIEVFDISGIEIATAKINTIKNITRDLFLIEKSRYFCNNSEKIVTMLTNKGIECVE